MYRSSYHRHAVPLGMGDSTEIQETAFISAMKDVFFHGSYSPYVVIHTMS
jgi:hypothetical protein